MKKSMKFLRKMLAIAVLSSPMVAGAQCISVNLTTSDYNGSQISCAGLSDGYIKLSAQGGSGGIQYNWSNGMTGAQVYGLRSGLYTVTVSDNHGCSVVKTVQLNDPQAISFATTLPTAGNGYSLRCSDSQDGTINSVASGGTGALSYLWSNGDQGSTAQGLGAGIHVLTVRDANGCQVQNSVVLTAPSPIKVTTAVASNYNGASISCFGAGDGILDAQAVGGTGSLQYRWSDGQQGQQAVQLIAGSYDVTVTDASGCEAVEAVMLHEPLELRITPFTIKNDFGYNLRCKGDNDGVAIADVLGGTGLYTYRWSNGDVTSMATQLGEGPHVVTVTDANGCLATTIATIIAPPAIQAQAQVTTNYNGNHLSGPNTTDAKAEVSAFGGSGPLSFTWSDGQVSGIAVGLGAGTYSVIVKDALGCHMSTSVTVVAPGFSTTPAGGTVTITPNTNGGAGGSKGGNTVLRPMMPQGISPNADGLNDKFVIKHIEQYQENSLMVYNAAGEEVVRYEGYQNEWEGMNQRGQELPAGNYRVVLKYKEGGQETVQSGWVQIRK